MIPTSRSSRLATAGRRLRLSFTVDRQLLRMHKDSSWPRLPVGGQARQRSLVMRPIELKGLHE